MHNAQLIQIINALRTDTEQRRVTWRQSLNTTDFWESIETLEDVHNYSVGLPDGYITIITDPSHGPDSKIRKLDIEQYYNERKRWLYRLTESRYADMIAPLQQLLAVVIETIPKNTVSNRLLTSL